MISNADENCELANLTLLSEKVDDGLKMKMGSGLLSTASSRIGRVLKLRDAVTSKMICDCVEKEKKDGGE